MKNKYEEAMDHVKMTDEMQARIMTGVRNAQGKAAGGRSGEFRGHIHISRNTRMIITFAAVAAAALLVVSVTGIPGNRVVPEQAGSQAGTADSSMDQAVWSVTECADIGELSEKAGYTVKEPDADTFGFKGAVKSYLAYPDGLAEIEYTADDGSTAIYRMSPGEEDNSGDYNSYDAVSQINVNGTSVALKGNGSIYVLAIWTDGSYAYSLGIPKGEGQEIWQKAVSSVTGK
ncbi:MAG: hypothetical protein LKF52_00820 [Butyrivibrio sp.]|nr:hypothetical protein [Butyrivibrio sp.]